MSNKMKKINIPEFTAQESLSEASRHYYKRYIQGSQQEIIPQFMRFLPPLGCNYFCTCLVGPFSDPDNCPCCDSININDLKSFIK